jgi:hypothetical protein
MEPQHWYLLPIGQPSSPGQSLIVPSIVGACYTATRVAFQQAYNFSDTSSTSLGTNKHSLPHLALDLFAPPLQAVRACPIREACQLQIHPPILRQSALTSSQIH